MSEVQLGPDIATGHGAGSEQSYRPPARTAQTRCVPEFIREQPPHRAGLRRRMSLAHWRDREFRGFGGAHDGVALGRNYDQIS